MVFKGPFKSKPVSDAIIYGHQKFAHKICCHLPSHLSSGTNSCDKLKLLYEAGRHPARRSGICALCLLLFWVLWVLFNPTAMDWTVLRLSHAGDMEGLHPAEDMAQGG